MFNAHTGFPFDTALAVDAAVRVRGAAKVEGLHSAPRRPLPHPMDRGNSR